MEPTTGKISFNRLPEGGLAAFQIVAVLLVLVSGIFAYEEFQYTVFGRVTDANIYELKQSYEVHYNRSNVSHATIYYVRYRWNDPDDGEREGTLTSKEGWIPPENNQIRIEYLPGIKRSRALGDRRKPHSLFRD